MKKFESKISVSIKGFVGTGYSSLHNEEEIEKAGKKTHG